MPVSSFAHATPLAAGALAGAALIAAPLGAQGRPAARRARAFEPGTYTVGIASRGDTTWHAWRLERTGDSVFATIGDRPRMMRGVLAGDSLILLQYWDATNVRAWFRARVTARGLEGKAYGTRRGTSVIADSATFAATRDAERAGPARRVSLEPTTWYRTFSAANPAALRIFPGDTVATRTLDAGGMDHLGQPRSAGGNPQTGPFHVEGAMPGDVVAIHLHRVRLNRDWAEAGTGVVDRALAPELLAGGEAGPAVGGRWTLDRARGVATLTSPSPKLARHEVPLRPMLGTIAVAPARGEAFRTQDSGPFGGNMDYNALREGTTVYLTVNVPGALLTIGDGHAAQGDGELTGDALETSMDVEFSVSLVRGQPPAGPRAEDADHLMSIGIAATLDEALKLATTDLMAWLGQSHGLGRGEVAALFGSAMEYQVADVVGRQVSVVAKLPKKVLARLGG